MGKNPGGPAFPVGENSFREVLERGQSPEGITVRQYYKAAALQGLISEGHYAFYGEALMPNVRSVGAIADAMIAEDEEAAK